MLRTWCTSVCGGLIIFFQVADIRASSGVGLFVCTYIYMNIWVYTGEINARRVRERYLAAVLRQDIAFFDKTGAGEVATRIQTDTRALPPQFSGNQDDDGLFQIWSNKECLRR